MNGTRLRLKNKIIEIKNSLDEPNHRGEVTENGIYPN